MFRSHFYLNMAEKMRPEDQQGVDEITRALPRRLRWICWVIKQGCYLSQRSDGTLNRGLISWFTPKVPASETPKHGVYTRDAVVDHVNGVWVRVFIPVQEDNVKQGPLPVVVYFHGGGFCTLSAAHETYDVFCRRLAKRLRVVVVSVEYRLAPEHKFPAAYDDCYAALEWLRSDDSKKFLPRNADVSRCFLMGESAGGNIVHHLGCRVAEGKEDLRPLSVVGHVLIQPYFGGEERTAAEINLTNVPLISVAACDWSWKAFLPETANRDHPAANVVGPNAPDISGISLPPTLVVIGGVDILRDWQMRYFEHLKKMEKEVEFVFYENGIHGFPLFPGPNSSQVMDEISNFMQDKLEGKNNALARKF